MERLPKNLGIGNRVKMTLAAIAALHATSGAPAKAEEMRHEAPTIERVLAPAEQENERLLKESERAGKDIAESQRQMRAISDSLAEQQRELARKVEEAREHMRKNAAKAEPSPFQKNVTAMGRTLEIAVELQKIVGDIAAGDVSAEKIGRIKELRSEQEKMNSDTIPLK